MAAVRAAVLLFLREGFKMLRPAALAIFSTTRGSFHSDGTFRVMERPSVVFHRHCRLCVDRCDAQRLACALKGDETTDG
jgi:hypothetical protein